MISGLPWHPGRHFWFYYLYRMKIAVKNMVCNRCVMVVRGIFERQGLNPASVSLGEVLLHEESLPEEKLHQLDGELKAVGFERIDDKKVRIIEKLKNIIVSKIHHTDYVDVKFNWSAVLGDELKYDYNYLSSLFSSVEGITLEHYIIRQKIERVKELLFYDELNMNEIADKLGYSSVQHLSTQFKKITGFTPSAFRKTRPAKDARNSLDAIR
jgi:AraC family transcriptional regulator